MASGYHPAPKKRTETGPHREGRPRTAVVAPAHRWRGDARGLTAPGGTEMSANNGTDRPEGMAEGEQHFEPSRRSVLHGAAGLAGAGLAATVMAGTLAAPASASAAPRTHPGRAARVSG